MTKTEQRRLTNWRLKLLQTADDAGNVARTCRHIAISRKSFYKWQERYLQHGEAGLADRARAPHRSPRATPAEVVSKFLERIPGTRRRFNSPRSTIAPGSAC